MKEAKTNKHRVALIFDADLPYRLFQAKQVESHEPKENQLPEETLISPS
jgi:hypothetical protein